MVSVYGDSELVIEEGNEVTSRGEGDDTGVDDYFRSNSGAIMWPQWLLRGFYRAPTSEASPNSSPAHINR